MEKGKNFMENDKLLFEGEYLNGIEQNGLAYNINGNIIFKIKERKEIYKRK